jgi:hypothetical protein
VELREELVDPIAEVARRELRRAGGQIEEIPYLFRAYPKTM